MGAMASKRSEAQGRRERTRRAAAADSVMLWHFKRTVLPPRGEEFPQSPRKKETKLEIYTFHCTHTHTHTQSLHSTTLKHGLQPHPCNCKKLPRASHNASQHLCINLGVAFSCTEALRCAGSQALGTWRNTLKLVGAKTAHFIAFIAWGARGSTDVGFLQDMLEMTCCFEA